MKKLLSIIFHKNIVAFSYLLCYNNFARKYKKFVMGDFMREYTIEAHASDRYKNGVGCHMQYAEPSSVTASAHIHEAIEILYIQDGGYTVYLDEEEYKLFAGDLILIRSGMIHHVVSDAEKTHAYYVLKIRPELLRDLASPQMEDMYALALSLSRPTSKCHWRKAEIPAETKAGLDMLMRDFDKDIAYGDVAIKLAAGAILLGLLRTDTAETGGGIGAGREIDKTIYEAMAYIRRHYADDLSVQTMANRFNLSYSYFSRIFKEIVGRSFKEYVNSVRLNYAERLLWSGDKTVSEIAAACGYNDAAYFIKVFREQKGCSPKVYKKARNL